MKTGRSIFIVSALFGISIGIVYWFVSHRSGSTALLALMAAAMTFAAGYMFVAERDARLASDRKDARYADEAGTDIGIFTTESAWPFLAACAVFLMLFGLIWSPAVAGAGFIALLLILWRLGAESNRL